MAKLKKRSWTMADVEAGIVTENGEILQPNHPGAEIIAKEDKHAGVITKVVDPVTGIDTTDATAKKILDKAISEGRFPEDEAKKILPDGVAPAGEVTTEVPANTVVPGAEAASGPAVEVNTVQEQNPQDLKADPA